jgi:hypothetical protein
MRSQDDLISPATGIIGADAFGALLPFRRAELSRIDRRFGR